MCLEDDRVVWTFYVVASKQRRLFARILQVLDNQQVAIHTFCGVVNGKNSIVTASVESQDDKQHRIEALLYRIEGVQRVSVATNLNPANQCVRNI